MAIEHRPGKLHGNADGLSRKPCDDAERNSMGESSLNNTKQENQSCMQIGSGSSENQSDKTIDLTALQKEDDELSVVRSWVVQSVKPNFNAISSEGYALKSLWSQFPCLELRNGLLVRRVEYTDNDTVTYQALVPRKARRSVLNYCQNLKTSGHLGVSKTVSRLRRKFYWPGLQADFRSYVAGCETCSKRKGPIPNKRAPMQIVRSGYPMERMAIDILGPLPETGKGNKLLLCPTISPSGQKPCQCQIWRLVL